MVTTSVIIIPAEILLATAQRSLQKGVLYYSHISLFPWTEIQNQYNTTVSGTAFPQLKDHNMHVTHARDIFYNGDMPMCTQPRLLTIHHAALPQALHTRPPGKPPEAHSPRATCARGWGTLPSPAPRSQVRTARRERPLVGLG